MAKAKVGIKAIPHHDTENAELIKARSDGRLQSLSES